MKIPAFALGRRFAAFAFATLVASLLAAPALAAPTPVPLPKVPLHASYLVTVNGKGQVVKIVSKDWSKDRRFNIVTYGNAVQAFIRRDDGTVVLGTFRLGYDYDPATNKTERSVELVKRGGVDPNAPSAVSVLNERSKELNKRDQTELRTYLKLHPTGEPTK